MQASTPPKNPSTWSLMLASGRILLKIFIAIMLFLIVGSALVVLSLRWINPSASGFMLQHERNISNFGQSTKRIENTWLPWSEIPDTIKLAAIAGEDQRFLAHGGIDMIQLRHAVSSYGLKGRTRGASTISQQMVKNLFLWPNSTWFRKGVEVWMTLLVESLWSKERILEIYLNVVQFGPRTYGIEAASQRFFNHSACTLSLSESALLISALPAPGLSNFQQPSAEMEKRANWILDQSKRLGGLPYLQDLRQPQK